MSNVSMQARTLTLLSSGRLTGEYWDGARTAVIKIEHKHMTELRQPDLKALHEITGAILAQMPVELPESQSDPLAASLGG